MAQVSTSMKYRKLRIAWSVAWGIATVLVLVIWARSYFIGDDLALGGSRASISCTSFRGQLGSLWFPTSGIMSPPAMFWRFESWPIGETSVVEYNDGTGKPLPSYLGFKFNSWISPSFPSRCRLLVIPYWFPALACGIVGALPWWRRLNGRFSLRTLLIATTFIAVALGLVA
jgi:hypothetical protein